MYELQIDGRDIVYQTEDWVRHTTATEPSYSQKQIVRDTSGIFIFYETITERLVIRHSQLKASHTALLHFKPKKPILDFFISLGPPLTYWDPFWDTQQLEESSYWFRCFSVADSEWSIKLQPGKVYAFLEIEFQPELLKSYALTFYKLAAFLAGALRNQTQTFPKKGIPVADWSTLKEAGKIIQSARPGDAGLPAYLPLYLETVSQSLFIKAFNSLLKEPVPALERLQQLDYSSKIAEAMNILRANPELDHSLYSLAKRVYTNPLYLKRGLRKIYGTSMYQYLLALRMQKAIQLILETDMAPWQIAEQCGYRSVEALDKVFSKQLGCAPNSLRGPK
jgi:AraC-like DNA-binding protein